MAFSFFKLPGHTVFEYQPRYFNPVKDKIEKRRRQLKMEKGEEFTDPENPGSSIKGSYSYMFQRKTKHQKQSTIRILVIIVILVILISLFFQIDLTSFFKFLNN